LKTTVLVFLKYPRAGQVKTRLARDVGTEKALSVYRRLLDYTFSVTDQLDAKQFTTFAVGDPRHSIPDYERLLEKHHCRIDLQKGNDLGERLKNAFEISFAEAERTIVIGTDCADLKTTHLIDANRALEKCDVAIGPAFDGGYYLLGTNQFLPDLFEEIPWSTERVFDLTKAKALNLGKKVHILERLVDIDTVEEVPEGWI
jgi:uncharacterized protein